MKLFRWEKREEEKYVSLEELILQAQMTDEEVTKEQALNISALEACIELISNTVAVLPIKLFEEDSGQIKEVLGDNRIKLLNDETGDTLNSFQFRKALIQDYLLHGIGYAYINKEKGKIKSLHYIKNSDFSINQNFDPIFKDYSVIINGNTYRPYEFLKITKNTEDGINGQGILKRNNKLLTVAYNTLTYENILAKTGGNKKGFLKSKTKLKPDALEKLKESWRKLYSNNSENCIILNDGVEFQEAGATPTEMQLNANKQTNSIEICKILNIPPSMLEGDGKQTASEYEKFVKMAILPVLKAITTALNKDLLFENEKGSYYFEFEIKELLKGDMEKRFKAYETAIKSGFLGVNEVRYYEDLPNIKALENIIKLGLSDVLYNTETGEVYTPNTDKTSNITVKGGEKDEDRNKE